MVSIEEVKKLLVLPRSNMPVVGGSFAAAVADSRPLVPVSPTVVVVLREKLLGKGVLKMFLLSTILSHDEPLADCCRTSLDNDVVNRLPLVPLACVNNLVPLTEDPKSSFPCLDGVSSALFLTDRSDDELS